MPNLEKRIHELESELERTNHKLELMQKDIEKFQLIIDGDEDSPDMKFKKDLLHRAEFSYKAYLIVSLLGSIILLAYVYYVYNF